MSNILETGLDRDTLSVLVSLCELGLNPEAEAAVVKELRQQTLSSATPAACVFSVIFDLNRHFLRLSVSDLDSCESPRASIGLSPIMQS
ncbi:hypothetical protein TIFTF001_012932 [Ficus carica]|uniref:Mitotic-spindle organizing protein 1 n=1 Tax=Ficus carica TaxID=3494 RepID=A0AA88A0Y9_FICCA|nr:hypothetical protein TIFTF001_012932 [Ficus carica]